jgi:putative transposase
VIDHFSRRIMGFAVFKAQPSSDDLCRMLNRLIQRSKVKSKHMISDRGPQFDGDQFKAWTRCKGIKHRYGAIGKYGRIAVIERFILSLKSEYLRRILVPMRLTDIRHELSRYLAWHNDYRPHETLDSQTPMETYLGMKPCGIAVSRQPTRDSPRALHVTFLDDHRCLPIVTLSAAA